MITLDHIRDSGTLTDDEKETLIRLMDRETISPDQVEQALQINQRNRTPLLDILGAMNFVRPGEYAAQLSEVTEYPYASRLIGTDYLKYDVDFIRRFDPASMARYLYCPLFDAGGTVTVLATDPAIPEIEEAVQAVVPGADVVPLIGAELDVKYMLREAFREQFSHKAVNHIKETNPKQSASRVFTRPQFVVIAIILAALVAGLVFAFWTTATALVVAISLLYVTGIGFRLLLTLVGLMRRRITEEQIEALRDDELPRYSILVPVYKEPNVVANLLRALGDLDYPHEKLDVLILMEEDDVETIAQAQATRPPAYFRFVLVPDSKPRTKPKACNYGLNFCRGEYVTIYDAEDIPEPDQLRKAVAAFHRGEENLICVQSALNYYNAPENYLTRMFTLEYTYWFDYLLPGLDRLRLPIPLGGTSNHFRMDWLRHLGAWDPFNVTEDADLGIRISANGFTVGVINSTTYEEANKEVGNWIRQRSRWIKGYMQTWLVHNRNPIALLRHIGLWRMLGFEMLVGGTVWVFLINPIMWIMFAIWFMFEPNWMRELFQGRVWDLAFFSLVFGNGAAMIMNFLAALRRGQFQLSIFSLTNPFYWVLHSIAAYMALWQLIRKPFYWEKTNHGLTSVSAEHLFKSRK